LFVVPLLLFHFIFDTLFTFFRRLLAGEHVFMAHRSHLYQVLNRMGCSHRQVVLLYSVLAISQGIAAVWMTNHLGQEGMIIYLPFVVIYFLFAFLLLVKAKKSGILL
jgi:UDP-GlcNAc:undecaprenyl-phosphate GlcNAc-1-phosphate transferase